MRCAGITRGDGFGARLLSGKRSSVRNSGDLFVKKSSNNHEVLKLQRKDSDDMQADAIPDWAIYFLFAPFFPIAGAIHVALGYIQAGLMLGACIWRGALLRRSPEPRFRFFKTVYLPILLVTNALVVVWGILTDPALP